MRILHWIVLSLSILGALNWGLVGFFGYDLVASLFGGSGQPSFGQMEPASRVVYAIVGLCGLALIFTSAAVTARAYDPRHSSSLPSQ